MSNPIGAALPSNSAATSLTDVRIFSCQAQALSVRKLSLNRET